MLSDPLSVGAFSSTLPTFGSGTVATFRKVANGKAIAIDGPFTADQPCFLTSRQRSRKYGGVALTPSDFTIKMEQHFNVSPVNGVPQADIPLVVEIRVISYPQFHTVPSLQSLLNAAAAVVTVNLARLQSGEGI